MPEDDRQHPDFIREFKKTRRRLPHWQAPGKTHFLTFGLLERHTCDLSSPKLARIVVAALQFRHQERYLLHDWVLMPSHVHLILYPMATENGYFSLSDILRIMKG